MNSISVLSPLTGEVLHELKSFTTEEVIEAFARGRQAQVAWAALSARNRAIAATKLADLLAKRQDQMMDQLQTETGKSRAHAFEEIAGALGAISYYAKTSEKLMRRKKVRAGVPFLLTTFVEPAPIGVVGVITPWNYPLALTMMDVIPALLAGNAVVQKADNQTAKTVHLAQSLAVEAGFPKDLWQVVQGEPGVVGNAITDNADYVAFTGSTPTGRIVAERAAKRLIGYSLELGGKNPMIILPGANLEEAAEIAIGSAFGNAGQLCVAIERVYVPKAQSHDFEAILKRRVESLTLGQSGEFEYDIGSLTSKAQLERVAGFVDRSIQEGGRIVAGGQRLAHLGPNFYSPTIVSDLPKTAELITKEVFGPVIAVVSYESLSDAIEMANATEFGLNASVVGDKRTALKVASKLMAGSVNINEGYRASMASMAAPMGGMKQSGMGRRSGPQGLLRFTEQRTIGVANKLPIGLPIRAKDYKRMAPLMTKLTKWL
jgi:acyl-CoA reductase-like NAD-dependent aldehyde dehydrogenase